MTVSRTQLRADLVRIDLYGIKRDMIALLGRIDDAALKVPAVQRASVESLADDLRWSLRTILEPLCEGRKPTLVPSEPMAREQILDRVIPDRNSHDGDAA